MIYLLDLGAFVLGAIVGSFLNVVILRYNTGLPIFSPRGRSQCFSCGKPLSAGELVPIFSFFYLRGRCRGCGSKISWQYPMVESITGLIFLFIFLKNQYFFYDSTLHFFIITAIQFAIWTTLIVITFYDLKHKIIPNELVYAFTILSFISAIIGPIFFSTGLYVINLLAGPIFFLFFFLLWFFSKGKWVGFGDAKLSLGIGFLLGLGAGLSALVLAFWIGAAVSILIILSGKIPQRFFEKAIKNPELRMTLKNLTMKSEIPFAPFLVLGTLIVFFCQTDLFGLSNFF